MTKWEEIDYDTERMPVFGGWIVLTYKGAVFVPDPKHDWKLEGTDEQ